MISLIHPSRGRPEKSLSTIETWLDRMQSNERSELIISLDEDDPSLELYKQVYHQDIILINSNKSSVEAINKGAEVAKGDILIVVSDDTDCKIAWDVNLIVEVKDKTDWILKTKDGIQDWIITMPVLDRAYYNRTRNIYDPDFNHMFCDTWLTVQADISGRKINSNLLFPHLNDSIKDEVRVKSDATWQQGEKTFIQKVKNTPIEDLKKITDVSMKNWIMNKTGIRL